MQKVIISLNNRKIYLHASKFANKIKPINFYQKNAYFPFATQTDINEYFFVYFHIFLKNFMQIQMPQNKQVDQESQSQNNLLPVAEIWRTKPNRIYHPILSTDHICNIEDSFFFNQKSLRDPQHEQESFLRTIFYFKSVSRVSMNDHFITLHLKKRNQHYLPKEYFIQRFKSFGNKQFYDIAVHLQHIAQHLQQIKGQTTLQIKQNFSKQKQERILEQSLQKLQKKKFFSFFYQFTEKGSCLNRIIISKALLNALGYDSQEITLDFLKYQQAIFEIISAKLYCLVMEKKSQILDTVFENMKQKIMEPEQVKQLTMFRFNDDLLLKGSANENEYERKIRSRIKFSKTHPSVTIFEIQKMNKKGKVVYQPRNKMQQQKFQKYRKVVKTEQIECIKNIIKVSQNCLQQNEKKMSSYRVIRQQPVRSKKRRIQQSSDSEYLGFD